jgi:uncharacterized membrane protein YkvA (DUF1232 family)
MMQRQETPLTFEQATITAESYGGDEEKLRCLVEKATRKSEKCCEFLVAPWESLQIFLRLLRAQLAGKFRATADSVLVLVAAVIYFVSPFDLIPDSVPVLGLIDDAALITCVAKANLNLISTFRTWEILRDKDFRPSMKYRTKEE